MQHELVGHAMIYDERRESNDDDRRIPFLNPWRLLKGEDLNQSAAYGEVHRHLVRYSVVSMEASGSATNLVYH